MPAWQGAAAAHSCPRWGVRCGLAVMCTAGAHNTCLHSQPLSQALENSACVCWEGGIVKQVARGNMLSRADAAGIPARDFVQSDECCSALLCLLLWPAGHIRLSSSSGAAHVEDRCRYCLEWVTDKSEHNSLKHCADHTSPKVDAVAAASVLHYVHRSLPSQPALLCVCCCQHAVILQRPEC